MQNWEILRDDGRYIGRSDADCAETAFCQYMVVWGKALNTRDVKAKKGKNGAVSIISEDRSYVLTGTDLRSGSLGGRIPLFA
jgi:hypothetical protein